MFAFFKKYRFFLGIYFLLTLFALRKLLLAPGIIGHNWDWSIPFSPEYLKNIVKTAHLGWSNLGLGLPDLFSANLIIFKYLLFGWGFLNINGALLSKIILFLPSFFSAFFMFLLILDLLKKERGKNKQIVLFASFLSGLFYGFSPFLFQELLGGAWSQFLTYPLFPLALFFYRRKKNWPTILALSLAAASLHNFILINLFLLFYTLALKRKSLKKLFLIYLQTFLFNLYWLFPLFSSYFSGNIASQVIASSAWIEGIKTSVTSFGEVLIATGYFRPLFTMSIAPDLFSFWKITSYSFVALVVFFSNLFLSPRKKPYFWLTFLLFSFIPATGGKPPLGSLMIWLYEHFSLMGLFRSAQHFLLWPTFSFAVLIGWGSFYLTKRLANLKFPKSIAWGIIISALAFYLHPFLIYGDLGTKQLSTRYPGGNFLDVYKLSPNYQQALQFLAEKKDPYRTLVLPSTHTPYYLKTAYQSEGQGGDPWILASPSPIIFSEYISNKELAPLLEGARMEINSGTNQLLFKNFLTLTNTGYLILRKDAVPYFGAESKIWDHQALEKFLNSLPFLSKTQSGPYLAFFQVDPQILGEEFSIPQNVLTVKEGSDRITQIINLADFSSSLAFIGSSSQQESLPIIIPQKEPQSVKNKASYRFTLPNNSYELLFKEIGNKEVVIKIDNAPLAPPMKENGWQKYDLSFLKDKEHQLEITFTNPNLAAEGEWEKNFNPQVVTGFNYNQFPLEKLFPSRSRILIKTFSNYIPLASYQFSFDYFLESKNEYAGLIALEKRKEEEKEIFRLKINEKFSKTVNGEEKQKFEEIIQAASNSESITFYLWGVSAKNNQAKIAFENIAFKRLFQPQIFLVPSQSNFLSTPNPPQISISRKNPLKYELKISKANSPFLLIFKNTFDPGWQIYNLQKKELIPSQKHFMANGYANAWLIENNPDQEQKFLVFYQPQSKFYQGLGLSAFFIILSLLCSCFRPGRFLRPDPLLKRTRKKNNFTLFI